MSMTTNYHKTVNNPQDPYHSYLVSASAGCGKTYQLSRRFLSLVAAGAEPSKILCVTFTRKAVAEMHERILSDATKLLWHREEQEALDSKMEKFFRAFVDQNSEKTSIQYQPPISAAAVGQKILNQSQSLRITTIDSLFFDWANKFADELHNVLNTPNHLAPNPPFQPLIGERMLRFFNDMKGHVFRFWKQKNIDGYGELEVGQPQNYTDFVGSSFASVWRLTASLRNQCTTIALAKHHGDSGFRNWISSMPQSSQSGAEFVQAYAEEFGQIIRAIPNAEKAANLSKDLQNLSLTGFREHQLVTRDFTLNRTTLSDKRRSQCPDAVLRVEEGLQKYSDAQCLLNLQATSEQLQWFFNAYLGLASQSKNKQQLADFHDLTLMVHNLFSSPETAGIRYLIQKSVQHLMLDEFQDTSPAQWQIFSELATELLSGEGLFGPHMSASKKKTGEEANASILAPTVFLVGDEKQSIYGFRDAEPKIMGEAAEQLGVFGLKPAELNSSFRTADTILGLVNNVFGGLISNFPQHATARLPRSPESPEDLPVQPDVSRVVILPALQPKFEGEFGSRADDEESEAEAFGGTSGDDHPLSSKRLFAEAKLIAHYLGSALDGSIPHPVWDKHKQNFRPLQPGDCAILYRNALSAPLIEQVLREHGLACFRSESKGYFSRREVQDGIALLKFAALPGDLASLATVLSSPFVGLEGSQLLNILEEASSKHEITGDKKSLDPVNKNLDILGKTLNFLQKSKFKPSQNKIALIEILIDLTTQTSSQSLGFSPYSLMRTALEKGEVVAAYLDLYPIPENELAASNLERLLELLLKFEIGGVSTYSECIAQLELLAEVDETGTAATDANSISMMTIHKAKGLEFPLVFLVDTATDWRSEDRHWIKGADENGLPSLIYIGTKSQRPKNIPAFNRAVAEAEALQRAELTRLLYVAITRSRQYLIISGTESPHDSQTFHAQITTAAESLGAQQVNFSTSLQALVLEKGVEKVLGNHPNITEQISEIKENCKSSPPFFQSQSSALPAGIKTRAVSEVNSRKNIPATLSPNSAPNQGKGDRSLARLRGTLIHRGLELAVRDQKIDWHQECDALLAKADVNFETLEESIRNEFVSEAEGVLGRFMTSNLWQSTKVSGVTSFPELPVVLIKDNIMYRGVIDLLLKYPDGSLLVVDYKTLSEARDSTDQDDFAEDKNLKGYLNNLAFEKGYYEQLGLYQEAVKNIFPGHTVKGEIQWVDQLLATTPN